MNAEDEAFMEARSNEPNPVAEQRAQEAATTRDRVVKQAIKSYGMAAVQKWKSAGAGGDVSFAKLSDQDKVDWILATEEYMNGYIDDAQFEADQREIATRYDADNAGITQESIDEQDRARAAVGQDQQVGEAESQEPSDPGGEGAREDRRSGPAAEPDRAPGDGARESQADPTEDNTPEVEAQFPKIQDAKPVSVGPTTITPKPIAAGKVLYRETSLASLKSLLNNDSQPGYMKVFVTDNRDLALGQGDNKGVFVTFRPDSLGGEINRKPSDGAGAGQEYTTTMTAGKAVATIEMPTADVKKIDAVTRRTLAREFDSATAGETTTFTRKGYAPDNTPEVAGAAKAPVVETKRKKKLAQPIKRAQLGLDFAEPDALQMSSTASLTNVLEDLTGKRDHDRVHMAETLEDALAMAEDGRAPRVDADRVRASGSYGWAIKDSKGKVHVTLIADRIPAGGELAAFMHEVGGHLGVETILNDSQFLTLADRISQWVEANDQSVESEIANRAFRRFVEGRVTGAYTDADTAPEMVAYFLEEAALAGIEPTVSTPIGRMVRDLYALFKRALRKLNLANADKLSAQNVVDLAWGAARMDLSTRKHGTGVAFRRFNHDYMGKGSGAQSYGFGTYIADQFGIARSFLRQARQYSEEEGSLMFVDTTVSDDQLVDWDATMSSPEGDKIMAAMATMSEEDFDTVITTAGEIIGSRRQRYQGTELGSLADATVGEFYAAMGNSLITRVFDKYLDAKVLDRINMYPSRFMQNDAVASAFLDANGVKGVIFADAYSQNQFGDKTFNRVIFNDDNLIVAGQAPGSQVSATSEQVGEIRFGLPGTKVRAAEQSAWAQRTYGQQTSQFMADIGNVFRMPVDSTKSMHNFIRDHKDTMPSIGVWYDKMLEAKQTRSAVIQDVESVINRARTLDNDRKALVNDFIGNATFYQKWGYDPKWTDESGAEIAVKVDPIMKKKFERLTPEEQKIVRDVFDHGRKMRKLMREIAEAVGVAKFFKLDTGIDGPYAALKRFGNYVGELKSEALLKAEADGDAKQVEKLKSDPDHYVVRFFDTLGAAQKFANANSKEFAYAEASDKMVDFDEARPGGSKIYEKILGAVNANMAGLDQDSKNAMAAMVRDMYYQSLDDSSARLSGAKRLNRAGYDKDMLRAFAYHGRAQANLIAQMKHGAEIATALAEAQNEARKNPKQLMPVYNIVAKKFRAVMTPRSGALAGFEDGLMKFNTFYMLTSSIGYHIQNFTQPMYSAAKITGDFGVGQYGKTWGAMFRGWRVASKVINTGFLNQLTNVASLGVFGKHSNVELDIEKAPPQYQELLRTLQLRDLLDVGVEEDLNHESRFEWGYAPLDLAADAYGEITHRLYQAARFVEANNRIASAIAAFDMAKRNPKMLKAMKMTPTEYVLSVVEDTQGNFSQLDAPALMDVLPKMTTQFRKYQFMMVWLHVNAAKQALKGTSPEMRAAGRRTLAMLVGHTSLAAGAIGVPLANTAMWAFASMFGEGDEPEDLERWIRDNVEDERIADLIARGVPAFLGIDMSQKLGQADIFAPYNTKFASPEPSADGMKQFATELLLGPTASLVANIGNIGDFMQRGDYYRAAEYAVPRGLRSYLETARYSAEGYTQRNNLVVADPRDFDMLDVVSNAIGLPSTEINKIKWTAGQRFELEQWVSKEGGRIRREYVEAYDARDRERQAALKTEWRELQDTKDRLRPMFNNSPKALKRQPVIELIKAPRRRDTEQRTLDAATGR